ncbi:hypothetical protein HF086_012618 [Spodoptera exigua]|uniref:P-type phospholipid transporter n=1 Tax=Spodoptera exigua TaxID=7107 RepID=A0A922SDE9_SPOEX|nr:hypothetical protein HF086_012618 [Spodoptera exigua]
MIVVVKLHGLDSWGNKVSATTQTRQIDVGSPVEGEKKKHNKIKTSKYTLLWFLPKNLSEQFRRIVNFYFLIVTIISIVIDSPVSPFTSILPLSFVVLVTAVKQGYEDWLRHKADNKVNNQIVEIVHKGVINEVRNSSIAPGTLVRVRRGKEVPADLVLLCSAGDKGKCYVTTANLDGETNLKTLRVPPPLVGFTPDILPHGMKIEVPHPVADLYTFYGRLEIPYKDSLVLTPDHLMLRGSRVKNTEWAIGCAVYTGSLFIAWDEDLRCEETGRPAAANTSDLNEELGQVEVLFSDKTGTLTKNLMVFKACSIKGQMYEEKESKLYDVERFDEPVDVFQTDIKFFFKILALCHSVQVSNEDMKKLSARLSVTGNMQLMSFFKRKKIKTNNTNGSVVDNVTWNSIINENGNKIDYQASSPDEKALVEVAERFDITFLGEEGNDLLLKVGEHTEMYERLQIIEFTSERKRMSVILRDRDGKETDRDINIFANKGLRTLAIAYREVPEDEYEKVAEGKIFSSAIKRLDGKNAESLQQVTQQYRALERHLTLIGATGVEDCLQDNVADTLASLRAAGVKTWVLTGDKVETAINVAQSCAHISENDRRMFMIGVEDNTTLQAHIDECSRIISEPSYRDLTLVVDGTSMTQVLDTEYAPAFVNIAIKCHAVLCCRLSPIQKAKIVKLIKESSERPITAAIGDGANDISMIQEAHVGFGILGREGHQAGRSADFAITKFSMIKKILLVMGHWYNQRLATLIQYFFYKNLVLGNIMCRYCFSPSQNSNPPLYSSIKKNKLMSWPYFVSWCVAATYHSLVIYWFSYLAFKNSVINLDGKPVDLWCYGAVTFHLLTVIVNLKLWLHARYHTLLFVLSVVLSIIIYMFFNTAYSFMYLQIDGDVLGTYIRLLSSPGFWFLNLVVVVGCLLPDFFVRIISERLIRTRIMKRPTEPTVFVTSL